MTEKAINTSSDLKNRSTYWLSMVCGVLMVMILLLDLSIPLGVAMGIPYIVVILISLWSPQRGFTIIVAMVSSVFLIGEFLYQPTVPEMREAVFNRILSVLGVWATAVFGLLIKSRNQKLENALLEREKALEETRILRGLLPICASCKKIRDDKGNWIQIEGYIRDHSEAEFSHGVCPECAKRLYPEIYKG